MVLLCGDGLFGPRAAERTCSEGPSPISPWLCGGGAGGSFGAAHSLSLTQPPSSVVRPPSLPFSISPSSSKLCILNIDRRIRTVRTHPPTDSVNSPSLVLYVTISFIYTEKQPYNSSTTIQPPVCLVTL